MLAAKQPLVVPMLLRLSHFKLNSYVVLVVSKQKGITLVFKTDPLQHVDINSTFDSIAVIQKFIQREIEGQLRQMFREDLPGIIHRLSQQWIKTTVEAPYLSKRAALQVPHPLSLHELSSPVSSSPLSLRSAPAYSVAAPSVFGLRRPRSVSGLSASSHRSPKPLPTPATGLEPPTSFPEIENFDPTYGLRPEGLPAKSLFNNFSKLFSPAKGLAELTEPLEEVDELDELASFSDSVSNPRPSTPSVRSENPQDYETIPAVGGGTITRPRVYLSQSQVQSSAGTTPVNPVLQTPSYLRRSSSPEHEALPRLRGPLPLRQPTLPSPLANPQFGTFDPSYTRTSSIVQSPLSRYSNPELPPLSSTSTTHPVPRRPYIHAPLPTPPPSDTHTDPGNSPSHRRRQSLDRRSSISSSIPDRRDTTSPNLHGSFGPDPDPHIILRPSLNEHIFRLSTLTHSNHTLSPFTRSLEHFAVRSGPPKVSINPGGLSDRPSQAKVKAKRKRIYRVGGKKEPEEPPQPKFPPAPASDFDESDMDRYFKWRDEVDQHQQIDPNYQPSPPEEPPPTQFTPQPHPAQLRKRYLQQPLPL